MELMKPALDPETVPSQSRSGYPEPYRARVLPRDKRALGDALGLTHIGINRTTLYKKMKKYGIQFEKQLNS